MVEYVFGILLRDYYEVMLQCTKRALFVRPMFLSPFWNAMWCSGGRVMDSVGSSVFGRSTRRLLESAWRGVQARDVERFQQGVGNSNGNLARLVLSRAGRLVARASRRLFRRSHLFELRGQSSKHNRRASGGAGSCPRPSRSLGQAYRQFNLSHHNASAPPLPQPMGQYAYTRKYSGYSTLGCWVVGYGAAQWSGMVNVCRSGSREQK